MDKLQNNKYKTVLADPPWDINQKGKRGASNHYELMTLDRIKAMPIKELCAENAHLYLWIPNGLLQEGLDVIKAWGFTFRSPIYWIKPRLGLGNYIRNASETCLFATRGHAPVKFHAQPNWLFAPLQDHSHKPEEQYAIIERLSDGPYLELFARRRQPGWDVWATRSTRTLLSPVTRCRVTAIRLMWSQRRERDAAWNQDAVCFPVYSKLPSSLPSAVFLSSLGSAFSPTFGWDS